MANKKAKQLGRTEDKITSMAPLEVILGGKTVEIPILAIADSRPWRKKYYDITAPIFEMISDTETVKPGDYSQVLRKMMVDSPDNVIDLFFMYAKGLDRAAMEKVTTDAELAVAFEALVQVALPLAESLPKAMARLSR